MARRLVPALAAFLALSPCGAAQAHVVVGQSTLRQRVAAADRVVRARILDPDVVWTGGSPPMQRRVVSAEVLELLSGPALEGTLRFAPHGHGVARYETGEEAVLFLQRTERSAELRPLAAAGLAWVSLQEHDEKLALTPTSRVPVLEALRAYVRIQALADPEARVEALRSLTLRLLASRQPALAVSALGDVVLSTDSFLRPADVPLVEPLLWDADVVLGVRLGLLAELERRGLVEAPSRWARLLRAARGADRLAVIRAAGAHPSPAVTAELLRILGGNAADAAAAAAVSLGAPGNRAATAPLARALSEGDLRLRMAAIRGLGGIGGDEARAALEAAAASHPDALTRRRAGAELRRITAQATPTHGGAR